ncbi:MAG TPA: hypothetical protein VH392_04615 [Sphingomicrobium sp.]
MKLFVGFAVLVWLICGIAGGMMLEGRHMHLKTIALGPISLIKGYNDSPEYNPY